RLRPITMTRIASVPDDIVTIQRYGGKTNEQFTHLLFNVTVCNSLAVARRTTRPRVLDPVAGRGTTLNRTLVAGYDALGIERSTTDVEHYRNFFTTWLRNHRIKHRTERERVRKGPAAGTERYSWFLRDGPTTTMIRADATHTDAVIPAGSIDAVVGDLPYGVRHRAAAGAGDPERSPGALVADAVPGWRRVLRPGAAVGLAWNTKTLPRDELHRMLVEAEFEPIELPRSFAHDVDRSIRRDLIVARAS
ncbi:MAG: SAM-dependent methyltransferase, partial [Actinomycetota bacterium]